MTWVHFAIYRNTPNMFLFSCSICQIFLLSGIKEERRAEICILTEVITS